MADIAIFRVNYKSDFILTLQSDAGWTTPFCIKFWTDSPQRAFYVQYDGETYTHCAPVAGEPTKLSVQMDDHHLGIGNLQYQIAYHFTVADFPNDTEDEVLNQAAVIIGEDGQQEQVMLDLQGETAPEIAFSLPAYANEAQRIANEQQRIANEEQRIANETERVIEFAEIKTEAVDATNAANAAASLANEKAQLADDKAQLADSVASLATAKAQLAQEKATYAQTQGDYAKAQGDYAKAQGDTAQADHVRAEADHTTAASDHTQAVTDHATATNDHTQADNDHSRAESDHTRAESDHAAVEVYVDSLGAFDISAYHATGGVLAKYADLTAALGTNGANIPDALRKGGMSVKFVQSSDNKYVQYRLMSQTFSTTESDWQGVDDVPTVGSDNLVKSGGVFDSLNNYKEIIPDNVRTNVINSYNIWVAKSNNHYGYIIPIMPGKSYKYINGSAENYIGILKSDNSSSVGDTPDYSTSYQSRITVESDGIFSFIAPDDAHYIYIRKYYLATMNFSFFQVVNLKEKLAELEDAVEHVKFKNGVLVNDVEIINDFCAGQDNSIVSSQGIADLSKLTYSNAVALSTLWNKRFYIDTNGLYAATDSNNLVMGVNPVLQGDCIEITTGVSNITTLVGFLNSIDNMAAGNQPDIMQGTSTKFIPKETTARFYAPSNGYFFFMGGSDTSSRPTSLKRFIPLRKSILMENLAVKRIIASGCRFNSDTDVSSNVINTVEVLIPANTEFYIQTTGIGTYSSRWGLSINGGNTVYYSDSLKKLSSSVAVTTIRILTRDRDFIASGEVSAEVYIEDLGTIIPAMQSDIEDIKEVINSSPLYAINVDTLKNAAGVSTNEFTESFSFDITTNELKSSNVIFNCISKFVQAEGVTDVPTITIFDSFLEANRRQNYIAGGKDTFECKQWRYPMLIGGNDTITVTFTIPSGVTLTINSFSVTQSNEITRETMKLYEHNGYWGATFNAKLAFQQAAICGYYGAIVVPKMTVDGVLVCYHDDDILSVNNDLQMIGGEPLTQELGALKMNELTFAQTQMLEYKSANIIGEHSRIPTLEEFFERCAKTGIHPCLSCHPVLNADKFGAVKALADKYHITDKLTIKQGSAYATTVFNVFGNSIEAFLPDIPAATDDLTSTISNLDAANFDKTKVVVGVEFMNTTKALEALNRAVGGVSDLVSAGYVWGVFENTPDISVMQQLNDAGCYEWTIGAFFCNGLNW